MSRFLIDNNNHKAYHSTTRFTTFPNILSAHASRVFISQQPPDRNTPLEVNYPATVWVKHSHYNGWPRRENFRTKTETITKLHRGEIIVRALCWSVMAYQAEYDVPIGATMVGEQVAVVEESRNREFPKHMTVVLGVGWRTVTRVDPDLVLVRPVPEEINDLPSLQPKHCLGVLGLPALTAYFGFFEVCQPLAGDVVVINGAMGFIGAFVAQLAKVKGCHVIVAVPCCKMINWFRQSVDFVFNYRRINPQTAISRLSPFGIDICFDFVGGEIIRSSMRSIKSHTRICMCEDVKAYRNKLSTTTTDYIPDPYKMLSMIDKKISNHSVFDYFHQFHEAEANIISWIQQGKLKHRECEWFGDSYLPEALESLKQNPEHSHQVIVHAHTALSFSTAGPISSRSS